MDALVRGLTLAEVEREYIQRVLTAEGGNKTRAAQRLGLDRKTLYRKLEEYAAEGGVVRLWVGGAWSDGWVVESSSGASVSFPDEKPVIRNGRDVSLPVLD